MDKARTCHATAPLAKMACQRTRLPSQGNMIYLLRFSRGGICVKFPVVARALLGLALLDVDDGKNV